MATTKTKIGKVECREAFVGVIGARPPEWRKTLVRDRHSGQLAEVTLTELPPIDEGDPGVSHVFRRGEQIPADHPAAVEWPGFFFAVDDD
jgi:hypothetical protein